MLLLLAQIKHNSGARMCRSQSACLVALKKRLWPIMHLNCLNVRDSTGMLVIVTKIYCKSRLQFTICEEILCSA